MEQIQIQLIQIIKPKGNASKLYLNLEQSEKNTVTKVQQIFPSILLSNQLSSVDNDFRIYKNTPLIYIPYCGLLWLIWRM